MSGPNLYIGAYAKIPKVVAVNKTFEYICVKCNKSASGNYCSECGTPITEKITKTEKLGFPNLYEFADSLPNVVNSDNVAYTTNVNSEYALLLLNHMRWYYDSTNTPMVVDNLDDIKESSLQQFNFYLKNFVKEIEKSYNIKIEIEFGIVYYWS